jgi:hypothetical protein
VASVDAKRDRTQKNGFIVMRGEKQARVTKARCIPAQIGKNIIHYAMERQWQRRLHGDILIEDINRTQLYVGDAL